MKALITGITGQDGSYLSELLLGKGYEVHGLVRRSSSFHTERINPIFKHPNLHLHFADLTDGSSLIKVLSEVRPDEIYNLAAQSHVKVSFDLPEHTADVDAMGTLKLLEAIRILHLSPRVYQASSSEMYGNALQSPQNEMTPFQPISPYGVSKLFSYGLMRSYRDAYRLHLSNGILFNHESPRRGETFVTRKITKGIANILAGKQEKIVLGNLESRRDWGYAKDYVEAMWLMLQQPKPSDYVVATGETHSVREFCEAAFKFAGLHYQDYVVLDERYQRPNELHHLCGDASLIREKLGWKPKTSFKDLIRIMVEEDLAKEGFHFDG